jgi:hypothetical protein
MRYTIEALCQGNADVLEWYDRARGRWDEIFQEVDPLDEKTLAERMTREQRWFEKHCGGRRVGREIMVITGIARFYSTQSGFDDSGAKARSVADAFAGSSCSVEVKSHARVAVRMYGLS